MEPETLAREFIRIVSQWLTQEEINLVRELNEKERNPNVCHSHDFCDANMAMLSAWEAVGDQETCPDALWIKAWDLAKTWSFSAPGPAQ